MFQSFKMKRPSNPRYLTGELRTDKITWEVIDTDFVDEISLPIVWMHQGEVSGCNAVIQAYSKRNLNVAANLALAIKYASKQSHWETDRIVRWVLARDPSYSKYEKDLNKYMVLV